MHIGPRPSPTSRPANTGGVILLAPFGYNSIGLANYKTDPRYLKAGSKEAFVEALTAEGRAEELEVLRRIAPVAKASPGKLWLLTLVGKQDLWVRKRTQVEEHYRKGEYADMIRAIVGQKGHGRFRHEIVFASLVISNFTTAAGDRLSPNTEGYDQQAHAESIRSLFETLDALRTWETES